MAAAQGGDREAMDRLLRRHQDRLWAICRRLTGNDADAADALQEAMVLVVRRLETFDGHSRFTTWAHRVTTNACLDELRRRGRRPRPGLPDDDPDLPGEAPDPSTPMEATVTDRLGLDDALAALPEEFRVPLVLRDVVGHDYAEISAILDLPPGTVRSRISRARQRMAVLLGDAGEGNAGEDAAGAGNQPPDDRRPSPQP